ncbi:MAG: hypothetical protein U5Q44_01500 [Dehalococcoidia bacterium]|nr:hypothetical protein [Dehalococcoidia bacterium]
MLLVATLLIIAWLMSRRTLVQLVPSESLLAFGFVVIAVLVLFQLGELG